MPRPSRPLLAAATAALLAAGLLPAAGAPASAAPVRPPETGAGAVVLAVPTDLSWAPFDQPRSVTLPLGWTASVWARPTKARLEAWTPDGRLLVSRPADGVVTLLTPQAGSRPTSTPLLTGLRKPHGLAFDGSTLYVAESNRIDRYAYADGAVGPRTTVLDGLPDTESPDLHGAYAHALKNVALAPDHRLFVSIGSTTNTSAEDRDESPERAAVLRVDPATGKYTTYAHGIRNGTGLAVAPDGALWTAVNNRDNVRYAYARDYDGDGTEDLGDLITDYVNDHPLEPLAKLTPDRDLGWPYCNPDPDERRGVARTALRYEERGFVRDVQLNPASTKMDCSTLPPVEQGLPAHSAPLGLSFTHDDLPGLGAGALVGVHGSWNRTPPRAPEVAFFAYADGRMGGQQTLMGGFQAGDGSRWGRPVAAVQGPDGALYVSDDIADAIYRLVPPA
ncbi:PQQ-dependent sugar dehydrogenase [Microlunatus flavus]|uniref:Glucose/arabinose dehydrogenase, beta-propeller fold n=1 Tax=Microlunatus flavus TaxID=1036181 RepID=A0A1H9IHQ3_9ACTN|nr:gluconolaconase [Microlunatus flavus]SEQ74057.1 Glucose/arabinose dehydrogenase, beta-propeller fold [Microlunatus flavus]